MKKAPPKKVKKTVGTNVRFGEISYVLIRDFCKENGYNIGGFCEKAALEKIGREESKKSKQ